MVADTAQSCGTLTQSLQGNGLSDHNRTLIQPQLQGVLMLLFPYPRASYQRGQAYPCLSMNSFIGLDDSQTGGGRRRQ